MANFREFLKKNTIFNEHPVLTLFFCVKSSDADMYKPKSASYSLSMRILTILTHNYYIREIILGEGDRSDMKNTCTYI